MGKEVFMCSYVKACICVLLCAVVCTFVGAVYLRMLAREFAQVCKRVPIACPDE